VEVQLLTTLFTGAHNMWYIPFAILVLLNLADYWATNALIKLQGYSVETNPILYHWMVAVNGTWPILAMKGFFLIVLGVALFHFKKYIAVSREKLFRNMLWGLNIGLCLIVLASLLLLNGIKFTI